MKELFANIPKEGKLNELSLLAITIVNCCSISVLDVVIELEDDEDNPFLIKEPEIGNFFSYIF